MLTETEKNRNNLKIETLKKKKKKKEKNRLGIWWMGSCPQNLACIHPSVSEIPESADDGRTTDDGRLRQNSSSADIIKQS